MVSLLRASNGISCLLIFISVQFFCVLRVAISYLFMNFSFKSHFCILWAIFSNAVIISYMESIILHLSTKE